jgi:hypothetical protein
MTLEETVEKLLRGDGDSSENCMFIVKFHNGEWDGGFTCDLVLPLEIREKLEKDQGSELEGYMTLSDFHIQDMKQLGAEKFAHRYKTALSVAMKSRITMHRRPR